MVKHEATMHETIGITDFIPIIRGRTDMADIYIKEADRCVKKAREAFENSLTTDGKERETALRGEKQNSLFTIMFSVFALEAHINKIGHGELEEDIWKELERFRLEQKWFLFPKLITGKSFERGDQLFKDFRKIIELRNYLVHFKDYEYKEFVKHPCGVNVVGTYEQVSIEKAELAYNTANDMMKKLDEILKK